MLKRLIVGLFALAVVLTAHGEDNFRRISVDNRLTISVPSHWTILDERTRRDIAAAAQAMLGEETHVSSLSVHAPPEPPRAIIRAQFVDSEGIGQQELVDALRTDPVGSMKEIRAAMEEEFSRLGRLSAPAGIKMLGPVTTTVENINGKVAIVFQYRRTGFDTDTTFNVTQYHIPLGADKALITLSYREQDGLLYRLILKQVKASITIR